MFDTTLLDGRQDGTTPGDLDSVTEDFISGILHRLQQTSQLLNSRKPESRVRRLLVILLFQYCVASPLGM